VDIHYEPIITEIQFSLHNEKITGDETETGRKSLNQREDSGCLCGMMEEPSHELEIEIRD